MITTLTASLAVLVAQGSNIQSYVQTNFRDATLTARAQSGNQHELAKINKDFGAIYKIKGDITVRYKDENKLRLDGHIGPSSVIFIVNGTKQYVRISSLGIRTELLRISSRRPLTALLELVSEREPGLLVFGPDRSQISHRRFRAAARTIRRDAPCLVWVAD